MVAWHEYPSNFSGGQSVTGIGSFFQYGNSVLDGWLGAIILILIFGVSYSLTKSSGTVKSMAVSMFITTFFSVLFMRLSMIHPAFVFVLVALTILFALMARNESQNASGGL